jgi:hypothetical protein
MALESFGRGEVRTTVFMAERVAFLSLADERCKVDFGGSGNKSARLGYRFSLSLAHTTLTNRAI